MICGFDEDTKCRISFPPASDCDDSECSSRSVEIDCQEFDRINTKLQNKQSVLQEAIDSYMKHGRLVPVDRQILKPGPPGCSDILFRLFEDRRSYWKRTLRLPETTHDYQDIIDETKLIEVKFKIPIDLVFFEDTENEICGDFSQQIFVNKLDTKYIKFHENQWTDCDEYGICNKNKNNVDLNVNEKMVCFEGWLCFFYEENNEKLFVTLKTIEILDALIEKEKNLNHSPIHDENLLSKCANGGYGDFIFRFSGNKFISSSFYSFMKQKLNKAVATVYIKHDIDQSDEVVDQFITPPMPIYCTINWHEPQQLDLSVQNQCIVYSFSGAAEYYLALTNNPSSVKSTIYIHHDKHGICLHGLNINSVCNFNENHGRPDKVRHQLIFRHILIWFP